MSQHHQAPEPLHGEIIPAGADADELFGLATVVLDDGIVLEGPEATRWLAWERAKEAWLDSKESRSGRKNTRNAYDCAFLQFFEWTNETAGRILPPWEVSPLLAEEWTLHMRNERELAESTINLKLAAMSSFYDYVQTRYVAQSPDGRTLSLWPADRMNPFSTVERSRIDPYSRAKFPSVDELKQILEVINTDCLRGKRDFALIFAFAVTCRRASELLELKWGDINHEPLPETGDRIYRYHVRKKGGNTVKRAILDRNVYQAICEYLRADGRLDPSDDHYPDDDDYIFVAIDPTRILRLDPDAEVDPNSPISGHTANGILKKLARRAGVDEEKAHLHALRHSGARLRVKKMKETRGGVDYIELMQLLEHSSLSVTQIYSQEVLEDPEDPSGRDAAEALLPTQHPRRRRKEETPAEQQQLL